MTKAEIIAELAKYGVEATTRPRKSTLEALLNSLKEDDNCCSKETEQWNYVLFGKCC